MNIIVMKFIALLEAYVVKSSGCVRTDKSGMENDKWENILI